MIVLWAQVVMPSNASSLYAKVRKQMNFGAGEGQLEMHKCTACSQVTAQTLSLCAYLMPN